MHVTVISQVHFSSVVGKSAKQKPVLLTITPVMHSVEWTFRSDGQRETVDK